MLRGPTALCTKGIVEFWCFSNDLLRSARRGGDVKRWWLTDATICWGGKQGITCHFASISGLPTAHSVGLGLPRTTQRRYPPAQPAKDAGSNRQSDCGNPNLVASRTHDYSVTDDLTCSLEMPSYTKHANSFESAPIPKQMPHWLQWDSPTTPLSSQNSLTIDPMESGAASEPYVAQMLPEKSLPDQSFSIPKNTGGKLATSLISRESHPLPGPRALSDGAALSSTPTLQFTGKRLTNGASSEADDDHSVRPATSAECQRTDEASTVHWLNATDPLVRRLAKLRRSRRFRESSRCVFLIGNALIEQVGQFLRRRGGSTGDSEGVDDDRPSSSALEMLVAPNLQWLSTHQHIPALQRHVATTPEVLLSIVGKAQHSPLDSPQAVALVRMPELADPHRFHCRFRMVLAVNGIRYTCNLAAVLRTAAALHYDAVFLVHESADPWNWKAMEESFAAPLSLPFLRGSVTDLLSFCHSHALLPCVANVNGISPDKLAGQAGGKAARGICCILGSEAFGPSATLLENPQVTNRRLPSGSHFQ
eukprot:GHVT01044965.1.p1 GENE.GHVT01044965.1~~GHVT01044965.1.p1  ORF type:complete len:535 (+),score=28.25 GHVT01044965.1:1064-2668(+)